KPWKSSRHPRSGSHPAQLRWAPPMKPWKRRGVPFHVERNRPMLQWGHGDEAVEERSWEPARTRRELLQWGHGDEAVEENVESVGCGDQCDASMGPRRRSRGRATPRERGWETTGSFNGATAM